MLLEYRKQHSPYTRSASVFAGCASIGRVLNSVPTPPSKKFVFKFFVGGGGTDQSVTVRGPVIDCVGDDGRTGRTTSGSHAAVATGRIRSDPPSRTI